MRLSWWSYDLTQKKGTGSLVTIHKCSESYTCISLGPSLTDHSVKKSKERIGPFVFVFISFKAKGKGFITLFKQTPKSNKKTKQKNWFSIYYE